tara:strand:- start:67 stop:657 length:591 start_codon:yes stop_codon:yes gene_type:complete
MAEFNIQGQEVLRKKAKNHGTGAVVYVPKTWSGQRVTVVREMEYEMDNLVKTLSREGRIVYSYYCLDIVHRGHLLQMENAKAVAGEDGISVVGILTDEAVMEKKKKPILDFDERMLLAQSIRHNDFVVAQSTYSPLPNVKNIRPNVLMESDSHDKAAIEAASRVVSEWEGSVITTPYYPSISSSLLKEKMVKVRSK